MAYEGGSREFSPEGGIIHGASGPTLTSPLRSLLAHLPRFFTIVASSLTGAGAVCTSAGFLAERSHLQALGLSVLQPELNRYLYTGAQFFAYLPLRFAEGIGLVQGMSGFKILIVAFVILVPSVIYIRYPRLHRTIDHILAKMLTAPTLLLLLIAIQLIVVIPRFLIPPAKIENLLFVDPPTPNGFERIPSENSLAHLVIRAGAHKDSVFITPSGIPSANKDQSELRARYFVLEAMVVTTAVILLFVALALRHPSRHGGAFPRPLFFMNCLLLACLILLLPTAYGVLQLPNRFQRVYVEFTTDTEGILEPLESGNYFLIEYFKADRLYYYLYSPEHCKMWLVPSVRVLNLSFTQIADVFEYRRPIGGHPSGGGDPTGHREAPDE